MDTQLTIINGRRFDNAWEIRVSRGRYVAIGVGLTIGAAIAHAESQFDQTAFRRTLN